MKTVRTLLFSLLFASLATCAYLPRIPAARGASIETDAAEVTVPADIIFTPSPPPVTNDPGPFTQLDILPNIETVGVVVNGIGLPETAELMGRQNESDP